MARFALAVFFAIFKGLGTSGANSARLQNVLWFHGSSHRTGPTLRQTRFAITQNVVSSGEAGSSVNPDVTITPVNPARSQHAIACA